MPDYTVSPNAWDNLPRCISSVLMDGWCYFITDDVKYDVEAPTSSSSPSTKIVHLVHFKSPTDWMEMFSHDFPVKTVVSFSVDVEKVSYWSEEIVFIVNLAVEKSKNDDSGVIITSPSEDNGNKFEEIYIPGTVARLKYLLDDLTNDRVESRNGRDDEDVKVEVKEELGPRGILLDAGVEEPNELDDIEAELAVIASNGAADAAPLAIADGAEEEEEDESNDVEMTPLELDEDDLEAVEVEELPVVRKSTKRKVYKCEECSLTTRSKVGLEKHFKIKHRVDNVKCDQCPEVLRNGYYLSIHVRRCHGEKDVEDTKEEENVECPECSTTCLNQKALESHLRREHRGAKVTCDECFKIYKNENALNAHKYRFHGRGKDKYFKEKAHECNECSMVFMGKRKLEAHVKLAHQVEEIKCEQCPKTFKNRYQLKVHKWTLHNRGMWKSLQDVPEHGNFFCDQCGKAYFSRQSLRFHRFSKHSEGWKPMRRPDKDKSIPESERTCHICGKVLLHKFSLKSHLKYVHTDKKEFKCLVCSETFNSSARLYDHKMTHTGELDCPHCDKTFKWKHSLTEHIRAHEGIRPYKCGFCTADFIDNRALKKHSIKVHGQETKGGICKDLNLETIKTANRRKHDLSVAIAERETTGEPLEGEDNDMSFEKRNDLTFGNADMTFDKRNDVSFEKRDDLSFDKRNDSSFDKRDDLSFDKQIDSSISKGNLSIDRTNELSYERRDLSFEKRDMSLDSRDGALSIDSRGSYA